MLAGVPRAARRGPPKLAVGAALRYNGGAGLDLGMGSIIRHRS